MSNNASMTLAYGSIGLMVLTGIVVMVWLTMRSS